MKFKSEVQLEALNNATVDTDKFLVSDSSTVKYRTGAQLLSDLGIAGIYVPYTGATGNVDLGTHTLSSYNLIVNHTSGSGVAASITKGGNGEALTINKTSGSGNAMSVTGGLTSLVDLTLSSIANATTDTDRFIVSDGGAIKYRTGAEVLSDIGGQSALTNPITGTGTTNYLSKFTGTTSLGDSKIFDNGTNIGIGTSSPTTLLDIQPASGTPVLRIARTGGTDLRMGASITSTGATVGTYTDSPLNFYTNSTAKVTINSNGNVGIGTTAPAAALQVKGNDGYGTQLLLEDSLYPSTYFYQGYNGSSKVVKLGTTDSAGIITFAPGNTESVRLLANGNVGIGTSSPGSKLDVNGDIGYLAESAIYPRQKSVASDWYLGKFDGGSRINNSLGSSGDNAFQIGYYGGGTFAPNIKLSAGGGNISYINSGNVGIGTTSPLSKFHVKATTNQNLRVAGGSTLEINSIDDADSAYIPVTFRASSFNFSNGNVGIGTSAPSQKLEVAGGNIRVFGGVISIEQSIGASPTFNLNQIGLVNWYLTNTATTGLFKIGNGNGDLFNITTAGAVRLNSYGSGTFTGTATQKLAVDSSGNIIEIPIGAGPVDGSGTTNFVTKWTDADTIGNSSIFDNGTNVGIGTALPSSKLSVSGSANVTLGLTVSNSDDGRTAPTGSLLVTNGNYGSTTTTGAIILSGGAGNNSTSSGWYLGSKNTAGVGGPAPYLSFGLAQADSASSYAIGSEYMRITSSGNVGIGTSVPYTKLDVSGAIRSSAPDNPTVYYAELYANYDSANLGGVRTSQGNLIRYASDNSATYVGVGDTMTIKSGNVGIGTASPGERLSIFASTSTSLGLSLTPAGWNNARHRFVVPLSGDSSELSFNWNGSTRDYSGYGASFIGLSQGTITFSSGSGDPAERMRITSAGDVAIGTSSAFTLGGTAKLSVYASGPSTFGLSSTDAVYLRRYGTGQYQFQTTSNGGNNGDLSLQTYGGNVGIGTSSPSTKLQIEGTGTGAWLTINRTDTGTNIVDFTQSGTRLGYAGYIGNDLTLNNATASNTIFSTNNVERMRITSTGNVGIGTSSPSYTLDVNGTGRFTGVLTGTSAIFNLGATTAFELNSVTGYNSSINYGVNNTYYFTAQVLGDATNLGDYRIYSYSAGEVFKIKYSTGNVGIGTSSPAQKLDVSGNIKASGSVQVGDDSTTASATNVGATRYRSDSNNSYMDMVMQTGASTYAWVNVVQNTWV